MIGKESKLNLSVNVTREFMPPSPLPERLLKNCQFLTNRYKILPLLPKGGKCAEVGVLAGDFSQHILDATEPKELHLIDVFNCDDYPAQKRFAAKENEAFVKGRYQKQISDGVITVKTGLSWEVLATYEDHYFDWIYIDAAHDYKSVAKDLAVAGKKLKHDGILVLNDYILFDHRSKSDYGVVQAANEFMLTHNFEMIYYAFHPELFCDVAIKRVRE